LLSDFETDVLGIPVNYRELQQPTRKRAALRVEVSSSRQQASRARHRRGGKSDASRNGIHRRRGKRTS